MTSYLGIITQLLKVLFFFASPFHADVLPCTSRGPAAWGNGTAFCGAELKGFTLHHFQASLSTSLLLCACSWREKRFIKWISLQWLWITCRILISNFFFLFSPLLRWKEKLFLCNWDLIPLSKGRRQRDIVFWIWSQHREKIRIHVVEQW